MTYSQQSWHTTAKSAATDEKNRAIEWLRREYASNGPNAEHARILLLLLGR